MSIYREILLDHYKHPRNFKKLDGAAAHIENPSCGDEIEIFVEVRNDVIYDISFQGSGCVISMASASMLTEFVKGKNLHRISSMDQADIEKLLSIKLSASRLKCALLPLEALQKVLNTIKK